MTKLYKPNALGTPKRRYRLIKDSETIMVDDWLVDESTGMADVDATGEKIYGYATAIVAPNKTSFESTSVTTGDYGGTWTSSTKQYAAAADNSTVDGILVEYVPVREGDQFIATLDDDKGTTTGSDLPGYFLAIKTSDASLLEESGASTSEASTQFRVVDGYEQGADTEVIVEVIVRGTNQYTAD